MEEEDEDDLPEIEEDEIQGEEGPLAYNEEWPPPPSNKETATDNELHPKLIPLVISVVFLMITLAVVSFLILGLFCLNTLSHITLGARGLS